MITCLLTLAITRNPISIRAFDGLDSTADVAVVGAGAAGLVTAIMAARVAGLAAGSRFKIFLLDSREKIGAKILISGGTRCNVTNQEVTPSDYQGGPAHFVKHVLESFTPAQTIRFFEEIGVALVLEPSGKYFPTTHSGKTVLEALLREADRLNIGFKKGVKIHVITKEKDLFRLSGHRSAGAKEPYHAAARRVVLATGGLSYPETGSDGTGLVIAKDFGHTIVPTAPALTPLTTEDEDWKALSGITMPARLSFFKKGQKQADVEGSFLFTHFGFSGPAALDVSRYWAKAVPTDQPRIEVSFLPRETEESLRRRFEAYRGKYADRLLKSFFVEEFLLPERFVEIFLKKTAIDTRISMGQMKKGVFLHRLLNYSLPVTGVVGYKKAEVTAGGVDLREIKVSSMESKLVAGLYFAGEILDVDGRIGGFNFQWAWSSGALAGHRSAGASVAGRSGVRGLGLPVEKLCDKLKKL